MSPTLNYLIARGEADVAGIDAGFNVRGKLTICEFAGSNRRPHEYYDLIAEPVLNGEAPAGKKSKIVFLTRPQPDLLPRRRDNSVRFWLYE